MIQITSGNFEKEVMGSNIPVFIDFYADWCGPCKMMSPIVDELEGDYTGKVKFGKCNIDDNLELAQKFRVLSIPTFIVFKDGSPQEAIIGGCSKNELIAKIDSQL